MIIYKITNTIPDKNGNFKAYVGQTSRSLKKRFNEHAKCRSSAIGKAIQKYKRENFTVEMLEACETIDQANEREKYWIDFYNTIAPNGYNLTDGGKNCVYSKETCRKISVAQKITAKLNAQMPERYDQLMTALEKAHAVMAEKRRRNEVHVSQRARENMSASAKRRAQTPEGRAHLQAASDKAKAVLAETLKDPEKRAELYADRKGRHLSDKGRANLSAGAKRRAQTPEGKAHLAAMSAKAKALAEERRHQKLEQQSNDKGDQNG